MTVEGRRYRGVSASARRVERRALLRRAGLDLIGEAGVGSVSAEAVSARAGLTKRYFYESYTDRDALLSELIEDVFTEVRTEILDRLRDTPPHAARRARAIVTVLIDFMRRDPRRARLYVEAPGHQVLRERLDVAFSTYTSLLLDTFPDSGPERPGQRHRRALAALIIVSGTTQAVITWLQGGLKLDRDAVIDEITRVMLNALDNTPQST